MYLFTRTNTVAGTHVREAMSFSVDIATYVNTHSDLDVSLHNFVFGRPMGTVAWSCMVDTHADMAAATAQLLADDSYLDQTSKGAELFVGPAEDALREVLHAAGEVDGPTAYTSSVLAQANVERIADVVAWGANMADLINRISGRTCMFLADAYGPFGGVAWLTAYDDAAAIDGMRIALREHPDYLAAMAESGGLFVPGSGRTSLVQRVA